MKKVRKEDLDYVRKVDPKDTEFAKDGNCIGTDTEAFFTEEKGEHYAPEVKRVCRACTVKFECLSFALKYNMLGYWGNTTELQRRQIKRMGREAA